MNAFLVFIILMVVLISVGLYFSSKSHYVCTECGACFKLGFLKDFFCFRILAQRLTKCPNCGKIMLPHIERD